MKPDLFQSPDYYNLDDLLTDRAQISAFSCMGKTWSISNYRRICSKAEFPKQILKGLADIGGGPYPEEYGGAGLDQISYGLMQQIERGDREFYFFGSIVFSYVSYLEIW
jgi:glutaryl-CoA dehydrogenase